MHALISPQYLWLAEGLLTALILGLVFSVAVGVMLLASPKALFAMNQRLSRWVDTSAGFQKLEQPHNSERLFYRHHRIIGTLVTVGAVFVLWRWLFAFPKATVKVLFLGTHASPNAAWLVPAIDWLIIGLHVFVLVIGVVIFARPSLLKGLEKTANAWHRVPAAPLDKVIGTLDTGFALYPRLGGLLLISAAGGCLVSLLPMLLDRLRG
jgi:hypothetical protein